MKGLHTLKLFLIILLVTSCGTHGYHNVRKGETLYSISWWYGLDYRELAAWNQIKPPYVIRQGTRIRLVPPPGDLNYRPPIQAKADSKSRKASSWKKSHKVKARVSSTGKASIRKIKWSWPTTGKIINAYSSTDRLKNGIDIQTKRGRPVYAASSTSGGTGKKEDSAKLSPERNHTDLRCRDQLMTISYAFANIGSARIFHEGFGIQGKAG